MKESNGKKVKIIINENPPLLSKPENSLLQALKEKNIFLPSACGGHGLCGLCRVKILEGAPDNFTPQEQAQLGAAEQKDGIRLACQVKLTRDLRLSIPETFFKTREYKATVAEIGNLTRDIKEIKLRLPEPSSISFKSGQYIQLRIPPYGQSKKTVYRAYSIATPPTSGNLLELEISRVRNGIATTYIFEHLKKGDSIAFNGPHGDFFMRDSDKEIVMIAGGSGMAPMKSMLADMQDRQIKRKTRFFFGARSPSDIFYRDLMNQFEAAMPHFKFIPTVAGKLPGKKWEGEMGLVTDAVERRLEENFAGEAYLCGSPAMIEACLDILRQKKVSEDRIFYDKFA